MTSLRERHTLSFLQQQTLAEKSAGDYISGSLFPGCNALWEYPKWRPVAEDPLQDLCGQARNTRASGLDLL
jgi:hypothetical protein